MRREPVRYCKGVRAMLLASALALVALSAASGQAPSSAPAAAPDTSAKTQLPAFDVVSIKPDKSGSMMIHIGLRSDGISITNFPVHMALREALGISDNQLFGEPGWLNSDRFDIEAKVAADDVPKLKALDESQRWKMLLPVFEDRFALKFHHETRDLLQYVLVPAKGGVKLKEAASGNSDPGAPKTGDGKGGGEPMMRAGPGEIILQDAPISGLVRFLSFQFHSSIVDKTGLTGKYDFDLKWTPDEMEGNLPKAPDGAQPGAENPAPPPTTGPSLFTALEEQLGLKLESHKEPGDVIVIDHIDQPSPN
jgi:uncharacterized protein (TIGR03435 family)